MKRLDTRPNPLSTSAVSRSPRLRQLLTSAIRQRGLQQRCLPVLLCLAASQCSPERALAPARQQGISAQVGVHVSDDSWPPETHRPLQFLPPLIKSESQEGGIFDATIPPTVRICHVEGAACSESWLFFLGSGKTSVKIETDDDGESYYLLMWRPSSRQSPDGLYRISVLARGLNIGTTLVQLVDSRAHDTHDCSDCYVMQRQSTLPIKFRIETALKISNNDGGALESLDGRVELSIPPGALDSDSAVLSLHMSDDTLPHKDELWTPVAGPYTVDLQGAELVQNAALTFRIPDDDGNGLIDGTSTPKVFARALQYFPTFNEWGAPPGEEQAVSSDGSQLTISISHFSVSEFLLNAVSPWTPPATITWTVVGQPSHAPVGLPAWTHSAAVEDIQHALSRWEAITSEVGLHFRQVGLGDYPNITFVFSSSIVLFPKQGLSGELGYAPESPVVNPLGPFRHIYFYDAIPWRRRWDNSVGTLWEVAMHEVGHVLGLRHDCSFDPNSGCIMAPEPGLGPDVPLRPLGLALSDLVQVRSRYGIPYPAPQDLVHFGAVPRPFSAGASHACMVDAISSEPWCWGINTGGDFLGSTSAETCVDASAGVEVPCSSHPLHGPTGIQAATISAGVLQTCAVTSSASLECWGTQELHSPGDFHRVTLATNGLHGCALDGVGRAFCWGVLNLFGELGNGTTTPSASPQAVAPSSAGAELHFASIAAGGFHTCGVTLSGRLYCWGVNYNRELGTATNEICHDGAACSTVPVEVSDPDGLRYLSVVAGGGFTCALAETNSARCWGRNEIGEAGIGRTGQVTVPTDVRTNVKFSQLSAGWRHVCGISLGRDAYCWGSDLAGELGNIWVTEQCVEGPCSTVPVAVDAQLRLTPTSPARRRFVSISAGGRTTCAVTAEGVGVCWGDNTYGQIGDGSHLSNPVPVSVLGQQ